MRTKVIDLGPNQETLDDFRLKDRDWQHTTSNLAAEYKVSVDELRSFAGREANISRGEVYRPPTPEEVEKQQRDYMERTLRTEEGFERAAEHPHFVK